MHHKCTGQIAIWEMFSLQRMCMVTKKKIRDLQVLTSTMLNNTKPLKI